MLFSETNFVNFLDYNKLSLQQIRKFIRTAPYENIKVKNHIVEWKLNLPVFLYSFYKFIYKNNRIPTQEEYYHYYLSENKLYFQQNNFSNEILYAIKARICRVYPSLLRDFHFSVFLKEKLKNENSKVLYNRKLDVVAGIDIIVKYNNNYYGLNLFTKTKIGSFVRKKKTLKHIKFSNVKYIELPINLKKCDKLGKYMLFGNLEYQYLKNKVFI